MVSLPADSVQEARKQRLLKSLRPSDQPFSFERIRVLVPGTGARFRCGGLSVALQTARILGSLVTTEVVTYRERQESYPYFDDLLEIMPKDDGSLWLVSWGFDVPQLLRKLYRRNVLYQAHSSGYRFSLPPGIPIVAVSRNTLGYWADKTPRNPVFLLPNALESQWLERGNRSSLQERPIDVLVQLRKSSPYVLNKLVPALQANGFRVEVQHGWVDDLVGLFNSSKVYIYDSAEYWKGVGVTEGFGLPPIEALSSGCVVFTSFNHALADLLTPDLTAHQIGCGSLAYDLLRINSAIKSPDDWRAPKAQVDEIIRFVSEESLKSRWSSLLSHLEIGFPFWDTNRELLISSSSGTLRMRSILGKAKSKMRLLISTLGFRRSV